MIDTLIIGFNETDFVDDVEKMKGLGDDSTSFKEFNLSYITQNNYPYNALDILTKFFNENDNGPYTDYHVYDVLWMVIQYLGTYVTKHDFTFDYINLFQHEKESLKEKLINNEYLTVLVTTTCYVSIHPILEVVSFIRKYNKEAKIVVGGPFIETQVDSFNNYSDANQSIFKLIDADFYIISTEGEGALVNLLGALKGEQNFSDIDNIAYREKGEYHFTPQSKEMNRLEENLIDYSLFPSQDIGSTLNVRTSKGCPFACSYCGFPLRAEKYCYLSLDNIEILLDSINSLGCVQHINFIDDTFNVPKKRFKELLKLMIRKNYTFSWYCFYRCDHGDEEIIYLMKEAGCIGVFIGIESANEEVLINMNKTARKEDYRRVIPLFKKVGITVMVSTIIGFPGETYESYQETLDLIEETKPDFYRPQIWWCDPLTPIYMKKDEFGIEGMGFNWKHKTMDSVTAYDLFERCLFYIDNSIYVPAPGFNAFGMFYLQTKGMNLSHINQFLTSFNAGIKEKLIFPARGNISQELMHNIKLSCDYRKSYHRDEYNLLEAYRGNSYQEAEKRFVDHIYSGKQPEIPATAGNDVQCLSFGLDIGRGGFISELENRYQTSITTIMISLYALHTAHLYDNKSVTLVLLLKDALNLFPVRIDTDQESDFYDFNKGVERVIQNLKDYSLYSFNILGNRNRLSFLGYDEVNYPLFFSEYSFGNTVEFYQKNYQGLFEQFTLQYFVNLSETESTLSFKYNRDLFCEDFMESFHNDFRENLRLLLEQKRVFLEDLYTQNPGEEDAEDELVLDLHQAFNF